MRVVYVDTGALIALVWTRDDHHAEAVAHAKSLRSENVGLLTSDHVIGETATRLRYDAGLHTALRFHELIDRMVQIGQLSIRYSDSALDDAAWRTMQRFDGLTLSFTDCLGEVIARDAKAAGVFGFDTDFRAMGLLLEPETPRRR